jgi:hypothetical protein
MKCYVLHALGNLATSIITFPCHDTFSIVRLGIFGPCD